MIMQNIDDKIKQYVSLNYKKLLSFTLDYINPRDMDSRRELLHETVFSILNKESKYDTVRCLSAYIRGCMKNTFLNSNRGKYKITSIEDYFNQNDESEDNYERLYEASDYPIASYNDGEKELLYTDLLSQIDRFNPLENKNFSSSMVIQMHVDGYNGFEIAKILGVNKNKISDILKNIKDDFGVLQIKDKQKIIKKRLLDKKNELKLLNQGVIYKGVHYHKEYSGNKWAAQIYHNYKSYYIGAFKTPEEAALAWNKRAIELKGENAVLNLLNN
jgi:RNA polymerase sigma factor (sigma-70 family)